MFLYRIVKTIARTTDLSGMGAFRTGGRWNNKGTYMLYTSENSSLAYLENLVYFNETDSPPNLFIIQLELSNSAPIYILPDDQYPQEWMKIGLMENKAIGDAYMNDKKYIGIKVRSAINPFEHNYLLNPLFSGFHELVLIKTVTKITVDDRLV